MRTSGVEEAVSQLTSVDGRSLAETLFIFELVVAHKEVIKRL